MAGSPGSRPRTAAILALTFAPGRCPPVPVLAPWPPLKWKAWQSATFSRLNPKPAEASS